MKRIGLTLALMGSRCTDDAYITVPVASSFDGQCFIGTEELMDLADFEPLTAVPAAEGAPETWTVSGTAIHTRDDRDEQGPYALTVSMWGGGEGQLTLDETTLDDPMAYIPQGWEYEGDDPPDYWRCDQTVELARVRVVLDIGGDVVRWEGPAYLWSGGNRYLWMRTDRGESLTQWLDPNPSAPILVLSDGSQVRAAVDM